MSTLLSKLQKDRLHHAHVVTVGGMSLFDAKVAAKKVLEKALTTSFLGNSNVFEYEEENLSVDTVRDITATAIRAAFEAEKGIMPGKFIFISSRVVTHSAQNALLKLLEEPPTATYFFILVPSSASLLPTVLSRVHVSELDGVDESDRQKKISKNDFNDNSEKTVDVQKFVKSFLGSEAPKRLELIKKFLDEDDALAVVSAFNQMEELTHTHITASSKKTSIDTKQKQRILEVLQKVADYKHDTSASKKLLLEYLALNLPTF